jgi:hypothetical protein
MEVALLSEPFDAAEALRLGLINRVVPADSLLSEADQLAARLAAGAPLALPGTPERRSTRKRRGSARFLSDSDVDEDAEAYMSAGDEVEREGGVSGSDYEEAQPEQHGADADGMPDLPPRGRRLALGVQRIKPLSTDLHVLKPQRKCTYGCGALVRPKEGTVCCSAGKHILGPEYNPPIDDHGDPQAGAHQQGLALIQCCASYGHAGRLPAKGHGRAGVAHYGGDWEHPTLFGTTYLRMLS